MERHFDQAMEDLKMMVLEMCAATERALTKSLSAMNERNKSLAEEVIDNDCRINEFQDNIDEFTLIMLAREQPVASDLRFILGSMHVAVQLERMGDQAVNISERLLLLMQRPEVERNQLMEQLSSHVLEMVKLSIQAYNNMDILTAQKVCDMDSKADEINLSILKTYIDQMIQETRLVERAVYMIIISRSLERIGDLATNICEYVIFIAKGINVKARCHPV